MCLLQYRIFIIIFIDNDVDILCFYLKKIDDFGCPKNIIISKNTKVSIWKIV